MEFSAPNSDTSASFTNYQYQYQPNCIFSAISNAAITVDLDVLSIH